MKKLFALLLAAAMLIGIVACTQPAKTGTAAQTGTTPATGAAPASGSQSAQTSEPAQTEDVGGPIEITLTKTETTTTRPTTPIRDAGDPNAPAADSFSGEVDLNLYNDWSWALYNENLAESYDLYNKAVAASSNAERFVLFALSEGKLIGSGMMLPTTTNGGNYAIGRVAPRTASTVLWGADEYRLYKTIVVDSDLPILPAERAEMIAKWNEVKGTGTYEQWVKDYLTGKGYTLKDSYTTTFAEDPQTWDALATYRQADTEYLVHTFDQLLEYDIENEQQPALATGYDVSEDGKTYTFHIREGVKWVDSQGREIDDVKADDWVAGFQHLLDSKGGLEGLVAGDAFSIVNAREYLDGEVEFDEVGVKATDDRTLVYTLEEACPYFLSIFGYNPFAPLCRSYYASQGGKFGDEFDSEAEGYVYGTGPDHIAYCGPYLVSNFTSKNTIVYTANPSYWNKDAVNAKTLTFKYNDGSDSLTAYNDMKNKTIDACGLNSEALELAKSEGWFDLYHYVTDTDATSFIGFVNINRQAYANVNDATAARSTLTVAEALAANAALQNVHVRRALLASVDRASYNAQSVGDELKLTSLRNSYVPGNFVTIDADVTVDFYGKETKTFKAGTYYGEIMQAMLDFDGVQFKVWDSAAYTGDGYDGFYDPAYAKSELAAAAADGITATAENPIKIEWPYRSDNAINEKSAQSIKQSVEASTDGAIEIVLVDCGNRANYLYAAYYPDYGYQMNAQFQAMSGWGPDYGDPQTYLATVLPAVEGGMIKACGIF
ncbi:MAG: peptide ABC transporter substrate-binding protein [Clostridia bacterium]|nr:peptide ABC transporter substrate-binding protein [Clostridia bacterium]